MDSRSLLTSPTESSGFRCRFHPLLALLVRWHWRLVTRRQLQRLDARALADLGLNLADQYREGGKPFWRE
ncbi:uncharacterized protein YjiS (DUF1127 family) [Pseudomonas sp. SORGH_AS199]|uniref:DUF1127 domain-containing protein n=1 Tax=Pseudomonas sp. SORGH_AS_0199 TaxID=3041761 RepID=UPI00285989CF|nr:DUF1127 domain-containing protein [Pseudomonas sp. SORGH_AS_0199]MDR6228284.1 uncharacterized protein YjiS (DUF1127 family) [Pseudomonas sp. SORGH_AS_0199]